MCSGLFAGGIGRGDAFEEGRGEDAVADEGAEIVAGADGDGGNAELDRFGRAALLAGIGRLHGRMILGERPGAEDGAGDEAELAAGPVGDAGLLLLADVEEGGHEIMEHAEGINLGAGEVLVEGGDRVRDGVVGDHAEEESTRWRACQREEGVRRENGARRW